MAPNDAVMVTSWAGCDVVGAGGCIAPCEGACEDHEGVPGAVDHRARGWRHTDYRFQLHSTMFTDSERNRGGKFVQDVYFKYLLVSLIQEEEE